MANNCSSRTQAKVRKRSALVGLVYFFVSGGQSVRTSIGLPSLCTVGAAELECPPASGKTALFSIAIDVLAVRVAGCAVDDVGFGLQLVSGLLLPAAGAWAKLGNVAKIVARPAAMSAVRMCNPCV